MNRRQDGTAGAFHNVCRHRGARLTRGEISGCDRRFICPWHGWVYDEDGLVVGVPDRDDFDANQLDDLHTPPIAVAEWGGWVWINLDGADAPDLVDWIGDDIAVDLGRFRMEDMELRDKLVFDVPVNYKVVVDGFNEVYHATELHGVEPAFTRAARSSTFHIAGPNSMMFVPRPQDFDDLAATGDHQQFAICHYVVFPNTVFNNNPDQIQLFQPVPLDVDRTRFICWELMYGPDGDDDDEFASYQRAAMAHWSILQRVVGEDVFIFEELASTRNSMAYEANVFSARECKLTHYHRVMDHVVGGNSAMDFH